MLTSISRYALPTGIGLTLIVTLILAALDRTSSAAVTAALTVVLILLHNLPHLETFKGLGVEAKLRERLGEAEAVVSHLRALGLLYARQMLLQLARSGRSVSERDKHLYSKEVYSVMEQFGADASQINEAKRPLIQTALVDHLVALERMIDLRREDHVRELKNQADAAFEEWKGDKTEIKEKVYEEKQAAYFLFLGPPVLSNYHRLYVNPNLAQFKTMCRDLISSSELPAEDRDRLSIFAAEVQDRVARLLAANDLTLEAVEFIERCGSQESRRSLYLSVFGEQASPASKSPSRKG